MAYVEIWKSGRLLTRRLVDEDKARKGCKIRVGQVGEVRVSTGESELLDQYEVRMFAGDPPEVREKAGENVRAEQSEIQARPTLDFSVGTPSPDTGRKDMRPDIEGYKIVEPLGEGGMGTVWRAEQAGTKRQVALKVMAAPRFASEKAQARFEREVELTARLDHPNIARIYDSGLHRGIYYYAMELVEGEHLDKYVKERKLSKNQILALMQKVCQAVLYAHLRAVIHRDLKPSNILVSEDGQPHVLDFGLAKALLEDTEALTISIEGQIAGTPAYMSPEQATGRHSELDTRTDVYSLGVILYELLTGQSPHEQSGSMFDLLHEIAEGKIRRPSQIDKRIDRELEAILLKALAFEPEKRYASAGAMAKDIGNYLDEEPLDALVPTTFYFLRKKALKHKEQVGIAVAVLVIIIVTVLSAYTKVVGGRAILRVTREQNRLLETELADLRAKVLTGDPQEIQDAFDLLERKYLASQNRIEKLQQKLDKMRRPAAPAEPVEWDTSLRFSELVNLGGPINSAELDASATISNDGLEMYLCSTRAGGLSDGKEDIWVARRTTTADPWGAPVNLGAGINSPRNDRMPRLSHDGLELLFASDRPGGGGGMDIYVIARTAQGEPWSEPENIGPVVNSRYDESEPAISVDNLELYFSSDRDGGYGEADIWIATRQTPQGAWEQVRNLGSTINGSSRQVMPYISSDGLILLFCSNRPGGYGGDDIYISRRASTGEPWSRPMNLGPIINSKGSDHLPTISPADSAIFLNSTRPGGLGDFDIWRALILPGLSFTLGEPVNLGRVVNGPSYDRGPCISTNGLELYFDSRRSGGYGRDDIWVATRKTISDPWQTPVNLGPVVNSPQLDSQPSLSADSLSLYFRSGRNGGYGGTDIWVARRKSLSSSWDRPVNLGPTINSSSGEDDPSISADGLSLYFGSDRPGGYGGSDLWLTRRTAVDESWGQAENLGAVINSSSAEMLPCISADELRLFFQSNRSRGRSNSDIWVATRTSLNDPWQTPVNLGPTVNGSGLQGDVSLSPDGSMLYLGSKRQGGAGDFDLWQIPILPNVGYKLGGLVDAEP